MAKHAPKGPRQAIDRDHPIQRPGGTKPGQFGPRCTATSKSTGKPCENPAIQGGWVCRMHGGSTPQVKAKARERLMELQPLAIQTLHKLLTNDEFPTVQLGAARDVLDRTEGKAKETVQVTVDDVATMSDDQLRQRVAALQGFIKKGDA